VNIRRGYFVKIAKRSSLTNVGSAGLPSEKPREFGKILNAVIDQFGVLDPVDIMTANRMVSTWMKMRYVEEQLKKYGLFFENVSASGKLNGIKMNEMVYYLKQLDADFRAYFRLLSAGKPKQDQNPKSFMEWIDVG